ncbi:MAG: ABC transporter substrate-binding protein [Anaerolineae bacterium]|nr:ABC transporter substrate-binding protein [Anaerolineae bacterium]
MKLQLDWLPNAQFAGVVYADYLGWYKREGINLEIIPWQAFLNQMDLLDLDENYVVSTEDNLFLRARGNGKPVKAIGTMMQYSGIGWMMLKKSGYQELSDLRGKRIGIHTDGELAIDIALAHYGMTRKDVEILEVGFDYVGLLARNEIDAMQCNIMIEPLEMEALGFELNVIRGYDLGYEVYSQVIVTTEKLINNYPEKLSRFLKVTFDGWRKAFENPQEVAEIIVTNYLREGKSALQKQMLLAMRPIIEGKVGLDKLGIMEAERWQTSINYLAQNNMLQKPLVAEEVMTNQFL